MEALVREVLAPPQAFKGEVALPAGDSYQRLLSAAAQGNAANAGKRPALILRPTCTEDVALGLKAAAAAKERGLISNAATALTLCGGGHSEMCVMDGCILMHMASMCGVDCDREKGTVGIGAGCTLGPVKQKAAAEGWALALGTFTGVGIGSILQGGVGRLTRMYGLALDNLVGAEVVLPTGEVRELGPDSQGEDAELFWGLRGGGASLAVTTRLTLRAFPLPAPLFGRSTRPLPPAEQMEAVDAAMRSLPRHQQADLLLGWEGGEAVLGIFPHSATGEPFAPGAMAGLGLGEGDLAVGTADGVPYHSLEKADAEWVAHLTGGVVPASAPPPTTGQAACKSYVRQLFMGGMGGGAWSCLVDAVRAAPNQLCNIMLQQGGGAANDVPADACAFNHRAWEYSVVVCGLWQGDHDGAEAAACCAWADGVDAVLRPTCAGQYSTDFDPFRRPETAGVEARATYPLARERLAALKARVDPAGVLGAGACARLTE